MKQKHYHFRRFFPSSQEDTYNNLLMDRMCLHFHNYNLQSNRSPNGQAGKVSYNQDLSNLMDIYIHLSHDDIWQ